MDIKRDSQLDSIVKKMEREYSRMEKLFEKALSSRVVALEKIREVSNRVGNHRHKNIMQDKLVELTSSINHRELKMTEWSGKLSKKLIISKEFANDSERLMYYYKMSKVSKETFNREQYNLRFSLEQSSPKQFTYEKINFDNFQGLRGRVFNPIKQLNRDIQSLVNSFNRFSKLSHQAEVRIIQLRLDAIKSVEVGVIPKPELLTSVDTESLMPDLSHFASNNKPEALERHSSSTEMLTNQMSALPSQSSLNSALPVCSIKFPHDYVTLIFGGLVAGY